MADAVGGSAALGVSPRGWDGQQTQQSGKRFRFFSEPFRSLILVIVPSLVLLGIEIYNAFSIVPNLQRSQAEVAHNFEVIDAARGLDHAMQDAERGQRGFLITGDDEYLRPYFAGIKEAPARIKELRQLTADEPEQLDRVGDHRQAGRQQVRGNAANGRDSAQTGLRRGPPDRAEQFRSGCDAQDHLRNRRGDRGREYPAASAAGSSRRCSAQQRGIEPCRLGAGAVGDVAGRRPAGPFLAAYHTSARHPWRKAKSASGCSCPGSRITRS